MKYISMLAIVALCLACGGKKETPKNSIEERAFQLRTDEKTGIQRMQRSDAQGNVVAGGAEFHYTISRVPCDSLPKVKDEQGNLFVDNYIDLKVTRNGNQKVLSKRFTKQSFSGQVEQSFLKNAILEGLVFDREENGKLLFAASVCYPQTDLFVPLKITLSSNGNFQIEKAVMAEEEIPQHNEE